MTDTANLSIRVDSSGARRATTDLGRLENQGREAEVSTQRLGKAFVVLGAAALASGVLINRVIGDTANFGESIARLGVVSGATSEQMATLEKQARELGATTLFTAQQTAQAQTFLAQAGFDAQAVLSATPGILQLATAATLDLATAADLASNVLSGLGLEVSDLNRVNDVLAATSASSNTNVMQLGQALSFAAPVARAAGISLEETAAALGILGDSGLQASRAGTGFVGLLRQLSKITPQAEQALLKYGISLKDVDVSARGLQPVLDTLAGAQIGLTDSFTIFGTEAAAAAGILSKSASSVGELTEKLNEAEGTAAAAADTMGRTLAGSLAALNSGISESILQIGDSAGAMQSLVDNATGVIAAFNGMLPLLVDSNKITQDQADSFQFVADAAEAVAILVGVRLVASMASAALAMNTASFAAVGLRVSMGFLGGPLGAIFLAAGSLVIYASKALEAKEKTDLLSKSVDKLTVAGARQRLLQLADSFKTAQDLAEGLKQRLEDTKNVLADNPNNPALVGMLDAVTKSYENAAKKAEEFKRVQKVLTDIVNDPDRSGTIKKQAQALADANKKEVADLLAGNIETEAALAAKKKLFQDSQQFLQGLKTPKELFDDQKALLTLFSETGNDATKRTDDFLISADQLAQGIKLAREEMEQLIESGQVENPLIAQADQFAQSIKTSTQLYDDQIQKLNLWRDTINSATGEALISQQQYRTGVEQARESLDDLNETTIESESLFGNLQSASERWAESFADSLVEGGLNFENFANGILKQLQKIALQKAFAPMFGAFGDAISGSLTPSVATVRAVGSITPLDGTPSADGGGFTGKVPKSVGLYHQRPNETVIDHTKGQKMGGGSVSVTVNVDASGSSTQGDGDGKKIGNMIGVAVRSVLLEESRPGGLLA